MITLPPRGTSQHDRRQLCALVVGLVQTIAVRRLAQEDVGVGDWLRIGQHRTLVAAEVAAEDDRLRRIGEFDHDRSSAEQVAHRHEADFHPRDDRHRAVVAHGLQLRQRAPRVGDAIEGLRRIVLRVMALVGPPRVFFLEVRRVHEDQVREILRAARAEHATPEALLDKPRQVPDVIQMRVREHDGIDGVGLDRQVVPIAPAQLVAALEEAAVHKHAVAAGLDEMPRPGDGARRAEERDRGIDTR